MVNKYWLEVNSIGPDQLYNSEVKSNMGLVARKRGDRQSEFQTSLLSYRD